MESTPQLLVLKLGFGFKVGCAVYEALLQVVLGNTVLVCFHLLSCHMGKKHITKHIAKFEQ